MATRLNGVSIPFFGVSWQPPRSDVAAAREVITFLEDRRALYNPYEVEVPEHVVRSVIDIRREMIRSLAVGGLADELTGSLRSIRAACRKFMDSVGVTDDGKAGSTCRQRPSVSTTCMTSASTSR